MWWERGLLDPSKWVPSSFHSHPSLCPFRLRFKLERIETPLFVKLSCLLSAIGRGYSSSKEVKTID